MSPNQHGPRTGKTATVIAGSAGGAGGAVVGGTDVLAGGTVVTTRPGITPRARAVRRSMMPVGANP